MNNLRKLNVHIEKKICSICEKETECVCIIRDYEIKNNNSKSTLSWVCLSCLGGENNE